VRLGRRVAMFFPIDRGVTWLKTITLKSQFIMVGVTTGQNSLCKEYDDDRRSETSC